MTTGNHPRFGTEFLFNWLSAPADNADAKLEQQIALSVLQRGKPGKEIAALGYSRQDWQLDINGISATLTFQNFAQRDGNNPRQFAAYTLNIIEPAKGNDKPTVSLLRSVNEQAFKYGTTIYAGTENTISLGNNQSLQAIADKLPKPLVVHAAAPRLNVA